MVEWLKAPVLKTGDMRVSVGSNPTLSAKRKCTPCGCIFFFGMEICRVGFERRLLAECRWHAATNLAFPQKRNPTNDANRIGKSLKTKLLHAIIYPERQVNDMKIKARMENFCHLPLAV